MSSPLRRLRIVFEIASGMILGTIAGGTCSVLAVMIVMPRVWATKAGSGKWLAWFFLGAAIGSALGVWLGISRALRIDDLDAEFNEDLDDVEPDTWPRPNSEPL